MSVTTNNTAIAKLAYPTTEAADVSGGAGEEAAPATWRWVGKSENPDQMTWPADERRLSLPIAMSTSGATSNHGNVAAVTETLVRADQSP
jgi:hypothetical protein